jgi:solute carrier family 25 carnitine/acylcarnitine transporter 20/29
MAGVNSWVITYPADVVKTRLQAQHLDQSPVYKSKFPGIECFKNGLKVEGIRFCFHGLIPTCIRAFPSNASVFIVWQWLNDTFNKNL